MNFCKTIGTGKTRTIVAAIIDIVRTTEKNVLVCANSNAACDEITKRLLEVLCYGELHRMYAKSYNKNLISDKIRPVSNLMEGRLEFPSLQYLYQFRVVVCTLLTAGCVTRARGQNRTFSSAHFSHIFIDEAACAHEPVTLIPIAGMNFFACNFI